MYYYLKACQNIWSWDTIPFKIIKIHWFAAFYLSLNCTYLFQIFSPLCNKILVNRLNTKKSLNKRKPPWHHVSLIICRCSSGKEGVRGQQQPRGEEGAAKQAGIGNKTILSIVVWIVCTQKLFLVSSLLQHTEERMPKKSVRVHTMKTMPRFYWGVQKTI